jgi:hypothetical protein
LTVKTAAAVNQRFFASSPVHRHNRRHILQLQDDILFDPLVCLLFVIGKCDERFLLFFGALDFSMSLANSLTNFRLLDAAFRNVLHLLFQIFPSHEFGGEFLEISGKFLQKRNAVNVPLPLKAEILSLFTSHSHPPPDLDSFSSRF